MESRTHFYNNPSSHFLEDFIAGYRANDRMSVVRRFFCLFITFDLVFITLLWIISIVINGENFVKLIQEQIVNYTIDKSLFDVVLAATVRFLILLIFYAVFQINHWFIVALTTSLSCAFLITKVFLYAWPQNQQPFQVLLIIVSFVISWFEAWFLDSRMIPQEEYSRYLTQAFNSSARESTPLLAPFLQSVYQENLRNPPSSYRQSFYSPAESVDPESDQDEEFAQLGIETVKTAYELLEAADWKLEKETGFKDTIYTTTRPIGKCYKLRAHVNYPASKLLFELFYKIEDVPRWNPTLLISKIVRTIDSNTDISYSVSQSGGGGIVKSRDFVNLRCWKLMNNSEIVDFNFDSVPEENESNTEEEKEIILKTENEITLKKASSDVQIKGSHSTESLEINLSNSCGAFSPALDVDELSEAEIPNSSINIDASKNVFVSAAMSVDYEKFPPTCEFIRGNNLISCWAMREAADDCCIFEWIMCVDLKGSLPKYVLSSAFLSLMTDYMVHLRSHVEMLKQKAIQS